MLRIPIHFCHQMKNRKFPHNPKYPNLINLKMFRKTLNQLKQMLKRMKAQRKMMVLLPNKKFSIFPKNLKSQLCKILQKPQSDKYIPVSENELVPQQDKPVDQKTQKSQPEKYITVSENELVPQQEKAHVTKFVDNLYEKEDYPVGKIVPVDAMRMMRDSDVKFIEVQFQNAKHAMNTMKMLPIFINVPDSTEYKIREPLSYSLTLPKIPSNPVKLFFGGKDMTIKELWTCKEIILQNKGNIVRINRGKDE